MYLGYMLGFSKSVDSYVKEMKKIILRAVLKVDELYDEKNRTFDVEFVGGS